MHEDVGHIARKQVGCGGGDAGGQVGSADQLDTALGDLLTNGGAFDVAAEVGCCAVHDHGTTLETLDAGCGEQHRGLAARDLGGGDDDVKAGGLFVDGSLLLSLLFGAQRAGITALALALGEVKSQIKELRAEGLDLALGGGTHVVRGDDRAKTLQRTDGLQAGDAGTEHQRLSRANRAGGGGHHRQEGTVSIGGGDGCLVAHHGVLRGHLIHGLGAGKLTGQLFDGDAHQTGLLERGHVIGIGEGTEHANDPLAGLELGHGLGGRSVHKTERVGFGEHLVTAGHLRTGLFVILIGVVGSNAGTCFNQ